MRPIALASFFAIFFISAAAHGAPGNLADFADAWGKGNVTHWPPPAPPPASTPAPPATPPAGPTSVPPALQPGGDPTMASEAPPPAPQPGTQETMQQTGQLPEGRLRDAEDDEPEDTPGATAQGANAQDAPPRPGVGSVNPTAKELWQFSAPKAK